jgi:hypothetical protein
MMTSGLHRRARTRYELDQFRCGLVAALPVPLLGAAAWALGCDVHRLALAGGSLLAAAVLLGWAGGVARRSVWPGLLAGAVPSILPLALTGCAVSCSEKTLWSTCLLASLGGASAGGAILAWFASRAGADRAQFLLGGGLIALLAGTLGCWVGGVSGLAALAAGLVLTSAPLTWLLPGRPASR